MTTKYAKKYMMLLVAIALAWLCVCPVYAASGNYTPTTDVDVSVESATKVTDNDGVITVTAKGYGGIALGIGAYATTTYIKITNSSSVKASISCVLDRQNVNSLTADKGTVAAASFSVVLDGGEQATLTLKTAKNNTENILKLSAFSYSPVADSASAVFSFDSTKGSVSVGGTAISSGDSHIVSGGVVAVQAIPATGCQFVGWMDENSNEMLSGIAGTSLAVTQNTEIRAVFVNSTADTAWFLAGGTRMYDNLNSAANYAASASNKTVVLLNNGILPSSADETNGTYTIPQNVTLLIPSDSSYEIYTTQAGDDGPNTYVAPTVFRKLTMENGAKITAHGSISLGGKISTHQSGNESIAQFLNGSPSGPLGWIDMSAGSSIIVENGGKLYAWGYIVGSGSVTIKNGGYVYEALQIRDWPGGKQVKLNNSQRVFPFSQYYIQNIEASLTLEAGATEEVCTAVSYRPLITVKRAKENAVFIGKSGNDGAGFIRLSSGSLTRRYDGTEDRTIYELDGSLSFANLVISIALTSDEKMSINSADYVMPINGNMTITLKNGSNVTVNQDISLLPGAIFEIGNGATCTIETGYNLYIYDSTQWGNFCFPASTLRGIYYAPGKTKDRTVADLVDTKVIVNGLLDASKGELYTTESGAAIVSDNNGTVVIKPGSKANFYQNHGVNNGDWEIVYDTIPITSAKLLNGDNTTHVSTADGTSNVSTYTYVNNVWCKNHKIVETVTTAATCGKDGVLTKACSGGCGTSTTVVIPANGEHSYNPVVTDPTCGEEGYTTYTCSVCDDTYTGDPVDALGHSYESEVTEPTCTVAGFTTHTCTVCGDTYDDTETQPTGIHTDADGKEDAGFLLCDGCNAPVARLASLEASADAATELRMKFYIHPSLTTAEDGSKLDMKALVQFAGVDPTDELVNLSEMEMDKAGRYVFVCNVNSGEMRRNMTVSFTDANSNSVIIIDGQTSANAVSRSVADYAELVLANGSEKQKNVIKALLTYGGYAQIYFNVDADNPVYNLLGETPNLEGVAIPTLESLDTIFGDIQFTQAEVFLQSAIKMQYTYTAATPDDDSFLLTYAYKNQPYTKAITPTSNTVNENTVYYLVVEEIPAAYFGHKYALAVTEGERTGTIAMSVYDYLYLLLNPKNQEKAPSLEMINLAKAMYLYGEAANAFFFPVESAQ